MMTNKQKFLQFIDERISKTKHVGSETVYMIIKEVFESIYKEDEELMKACMHETQKQLNDKSYQCETCNYIINYD